MSRCWPGPANTVLEYKLSTRNALRVPDLQYAALEYKLRTRNALPVAGPSNFYVRVQTTPTASSVNSLGERVPGSSPQPESNVFDPSVVSQHPPKPQPRVLRRFRWGKVPGSFRLETNTACVAFAIASARHRHNALHCCNDDDGHDDDDVQATLSQAQNLKELNQLLILCAATALHRPRGRDWLGLWQTLHMR